MGRFSNRQHPLVSFVVPTCPAHLLAFQVKNLVLILASCYPSFLRGVVVWNTYHLQIQLAIHLSQVWWNCIASWFRPGASIVVACWPSCASPRAAIGARLAS